MTFMPKDDNAPMLTRTGEYALQATLYIANNPDAWPISGPKIATATDVPQKYLSAVLATLVRFGVLTASPGKGGGFSLALPPEKICLGEILQPFEVVLADRRPCPFGNTTCSDDDPCAGHDKWKIVRASFHDFAYGTTVRDLTKKHQLTQRSKTTRKTKIAPPKKKHATRRAR